MFAMLKSPNRYYGITEAICFFFIVSSMGVCLNSDAVFLSPMSEGLGVGRGAVTLFTTIAGLSGTLLYPVAFQMSKRIAVRPVAIFGILVATAACFGMGIVRTIFGVYVCAVFRGLGTCCFSRNIVAILLNRWFKDKVSTMTSIALTAAGLSAIVLNPFFTSVILATNYRTALLVRAGLILLTALPGALVLKEYPAQIGLEPYTAPQTEQKTSRTREIPLEVPLKFHTLLFISLAIYNVFICAASRLVDQLPGYAENIGLGSRIGALLVSAYMVGNVVFKLILGVMNDSIGVGKTTMLGGFLSLGAIAVMLFFPHSVFMLLFGAFLFGVVGGLATVSIFALARYLYGGEASGAAMGVLVPISAFYSVFSSSFGFLYDATGAFTAVFVMCAALCIACLLLLMLMLRQVQKETRTENTQPPPA
jgi:MFS family permease